MSRDLNPSRSLDSSETLFLDLKQLNNIISVSELNSSCHETLATLEFRYTKDELDSYLAWRSAGLTYKSSNWIKKAAATCWSCTKGRICKTSLEELRAFLFSKYIDHYAQSKVLNFTKGFLKYQDTDA